MPFLSVIIPTYNCASALAVTLAALGVQTYPPANFEVIVSDDGSSDGTAALFHDEAYPFKTAYVRSEREGFRLASARNRGILAASGSVVILLDADMVPCRGFLSAHGEHHCSREDVVVIGDRKFVAPPISPEDVRNTPEMLFRLNEIQSASNWFQTGDRRYPELLRLDTHPAPFNVMHGCNISFSRRRALDIGLFDESFNGHWGYEDTEFAYRLWRSGITAIFAANAVAFHIENANTTFEERLAGDQHNYIVACQKIPGFAEFKERLRASSRQPWW